MSEEEVLGGTIEEALPSALYRVKLDDGTTIVAGLSTVARRTLIKIGPGDRVSLTRSPFDPSRGKITGKRTTPSRQGGAP